MSVPEPPPQDPRQRRHSSLTVAEARRMYAVGWTVTQIQRYLKRKGTSVSRNTIYCWVDPEFAGVHRSVNKATQRRRRTRDRDRNCDVARRLAELRDALDLSWPQLATAAHVCFDVDWTADQIRYRVTGSGHDGRGLLPVTSQEAA